MNKCLIQTIYMTCFYTILGYFVTVDKFSMSKYLIEIKYMVSRDIGI